MNEDGKPVTRRRFLEMVGAAGGAAAVYETMVAMGMLAVPTAYAGPPDVSGAPGKGRTIAVLGAGVAGLTAALRLARADAQVTVYEASDRIGGRNFTVSSDKADHRNVIRQAGRKDQVCVFTGDSASQYFEAGCGRIPYHHVALLELCQELKVPLQPYIMETRANRFQADGAFDNRAVENRQVANDTRGYIAELLAKAINKKCLDDELSEADRKALLSLLSTFGNVSDKTVPPYAYLGSTRSGYLRDPGVTSPGKPLAPLALDQLLKSRFWEHRFYQAEDYLWQTTLFHPVGGMRKIVDALHGALGKDAVKTGKVVSGISLAGGKVRITFENDPSPITVDYCISTIPLPLLAKRLDKSFSGAYRDAVGLVKFAKTCKVGWQANSRFWEVLRGPDKSNGPQTFGGISWIAHPITQVWYPSADYFAPGPAVLTGAYNYDSKDKPVATDFGKLDLKPRLELALQGGERLFAEFRKQVPVEKGLSIAWQEVPYIEGGWAEWDRANAGHAAAYQRLLLPEKQFIVAGDQVSYLPGWMEGAVLSAYHAVNYALGRPIPEAVERTQDLPAPDSQSVTGAG
jgi:monoamine oxidase